MKTRILALALVLVTLVTVLTGCAYRYDKKDVSQYVTVADDYKGLLDFLNEITIEGADFGPYNAENDTARNDKVLEKIDATLAGKITTGDDYKLKDDAVYALRQKIYYAYYCTVVKDDVTYYFNTKYMDGAKLSELLSNPKYSNGKATDALVSDDALLADIFKAINGLKVTEYAYATETTGDLKEGDVVYVTYKYTYGKDGKTVTVESEYMPLVVPAAAEDAEGVGATKIEHLLVGKKVTDKIENVKFKDADLGECSVTSMTVHFKVDSAKAANEIPVKFTATADKQTYTNAADAKGDKIEVKKDDVITYHIYPAYAYAVEAFDATAIIKTIFGDSISTTSLDVFGKENPEMEKLVAEVVKLKSAYDQANSKVTSAGSNATQAQKDTRDKAKAELDAALAALPEKLFATKDGAKEAIVDSYKKTVYDSLESAYDTEIQKQLGKKIWSWIEENVKVDMENLPKSAVKEAKERIIAGHKNTYYTGTYTESSSSTTKIAYTDTYTFDEYLSTVAYKDKDVDATIDAEAKAEVADIIRIYAVADKLGKDNVKRATNADITKYVDELYSKLYYTFYLSGNYYPTANDVIELYGKTALRASLTFDRIMDYFLATKDGADHTTYTNLKKIVYTKQA